MIRLYLRNYSDAECNDLYNVLHDALLDFDMNAEPYKDIVSALDYLTGYMDASKDNKKGGVNNVRKFECRGTGNKDV